MFKKNWYLFTPLLLVAIPAAIYAYYVSSMGYGSTDAANATKYFLVSGTRYAMDYDELNFNRLKPGMDGRQVFLTMGKQPSERHDNDTRWVYSLAKPGSQAYHERVVVMERDKQNTLRVKELVKRFHVPGE
ncbi:hypothetical protein EI77_03016 [Prosthecobacter fusiformis]|uniref:Uncharacterized protein n=1 Tax=Prosthecobacter fusiformis TaxID=48464 RepID=A0A4V3FF34_9BACT|nr:hypothetical protein [Prosthecobacter fusiformis]TDU69363.1 hypothetical protein EI77_03016 [Prosthecobacter fusiformis]